MVGEVQEVYRRDMSSAVFAFTWGESDSTCQAFEGKRINWKLSFSKWVGFVFHEFFR